MQKRNKKEEKIRKVKSKKLEKIADKLLAQDEKNQSLRKFTTLNSSIFNSF